MDWVTKYAILIVMIAGLVVQIMLFNWAYFRINDLEGRMIFMEVVLKMKGISIPEKSKEVTHE